MKLLIVLVLSLSFEQISGGAGGFPNPKPLPIECDLASSADLFRPDGTYIKTTCYVLQHLGYDDSLQFCIDHGMTLFKIPDEVTYNAFNNYLGSFFGFGGNSVFWINGKNPGNGTFYMQPGNELLWSEIPWAGPAEFPCLTFTSYGGTTEYSAYTLACPTAGPYSFCEFNKY